MELSRCLFCKERCHGLQQNGQRGQRGQPDADEVRVRLELEKGREFQITSPESELDYVTWRQKVCI